jgi:hypothetical protein
MKWIVKIENKPELQIVVEFSPLSEMLLFTGQYKWKGNKWLDFSVEKCSMDVALDEKIDYLHKTYKKLKTNIDVHKNLEESFVYINLIEVKD